MGGGNINKIEKKINKIRDNYEKNYFNILKKTNL